MKISDSTLDLLKNFNEINENIRIRPGSDLYTCAINKGVLAAATVEEEFEKDIVIVKLQQFLECVKLLNEPKFNLENDKFASVRDEDGGQGFKYYYGTPETLAVDFHKEPKDFDYQVSFTLKPSDLERLTRACAVLGLVDIVIKSEDDGVVVAGVDKQNSSTNTYSLDVCKGNGDEFALFFKKDNWKMLPYTYTVHLGHDGEKGLAKFVAQDAPFKKLVYYMPMEKTGSFYEKG